MTTTPLTTDARRGSPARSPRPPQIIAARERSRMTLEAAAQLIHATASSWRAWEAGERPMHAGLFELFLRKSDELRGAHHRLGIPTTPIMTLDPVTGEAIVAGYGWTLSEQRRESGPHVSMLLSPAGHCGVRYGRSRLESRDRYFQRPPAAERWMRQDLSIELPADLIDQVLVEARRRYEYFDADPPRRISPVMIDQTGQVRILHELRDPVTPTMAPGLPAGHYIPLSLETDSLDAVHRYRVYLYGKSIKSSMPKTNRSGIDAAMLDAKILSDLLDRFDTEEAAWLAHGEPSLMLAAQ